MRNENEQRMEDENQNANVQNLADESLNTERLDEQSLNTERLDEQSLDEQSLDSGTLDSQVVNEQLSDAMNADNLGFVTYLEDHLGLNKLDLRTFSPLTLAYIGDCIYEVVIRTILVHDGNAPVNKLHKRASNLVKASAQKEIFQKIREELTEEEMSVFKRGRNAKSFTSAKNATIGEYRIATGFEALMGYLYLDNRMNRLIELVKKGLEKE